MVSFRFEYFENLITKNYVKGADFEKASKWAIQDHFGDADWTVASVRQVDPDTVEIVKRRDANKSYLYKMGFDQFNLYQRVTVNRKDNSVAIDRMDANWFRESPFIGRRDLFYPGEKQGKLTFVRHDIWIWKPLHFHYIMWANWAAWSYKGAFKRQN